MLREPMMTKLRSSGYRVLLALLYIVCLAGFSVSVWAHVVSYMGIDPRVKFPNIWIVELTLTMVLLPLVVALFRRGVREDPLRLSRWSWRVVFVLLAYYAFHFYLFVVRATDELTSEITWHMFSAGWILLFAVGFVFYRCALVRANEGAVGGARGQHPAAL